MRIDAHGLQVDEGLYRFIEDEALPGSGVSPDAFWKGFGDLIDAYGPRNAALLARRAVLQDRIDAWHRAQRTSPHDHAAYKAFLEQIGYLVPEGPPFQIETRGVDPEIARIAGPQLVVPVDNARYALNAANARWGSLYDALYGTDAVGPPPATRGYDTARGARVVARARDFLDAACPLDGISHADVQHYRVHDGMLSADGHCLADPGQFTGYAGDPHAPGAVVLCNSGLHVELVFDRASPIGAGDRAGLADVRLEAAVSAIMDLTM